MLVLEASSTGERRPEYEALVEIHINDQDEIMT